MAKVKQKKMQLELDLAHPWAETVINICYDSTEHTERKRFYILLPRVVADSLGEKEVRGDDQDEAMKLFEETIKRFKELKTEVKRVICYSILVEPKPGDKDRWYSQEGIVVKVWAGVYDETVAIAGNGVRRYSYQHVSSPADFPGTGEVGNSGPSRRNGEHWDEQIPWTESNEAFFVWVKERMTELADRLAELVKPEALLDTINAGRLLPLGEQKDVRAMIKGG